MEAIMTMETMDTIRARHEYKHSLNYMDYQILRGRLASVLPHDGNVGQAGIYTVRSLYFDTPGDKALREKIDGVDKREKFRIRRYNDDMDFLRLEKKSKANGLCYKQAEPVTRAQVEQIIAGDIAWMALDERPLLVELYSKMRGQLLRPRTIVVYEREPFIYGAGNVRITFDRAIRSGLSSTDFFNNALPTVSAGDELVLLEVKYDAFIPDFIVRLLQLEHRRAAACSKYALCRTYG